MTGASRTSSTVSLLKTIVGAGLLSMPLAYATDGVVFGTFVIAVAALTSGFGLFLQAYVARFAPEGHATFFNICSITYPALSVVFDTAIAVQCFGCAVSYLVLVGDLMPTIVPGTSKTLWVALSTIPIVPVSFLHNLDSLKYTSILGLVAIAYITVLVVGHFVAGDVSDTLRGDVGNFPPTASGVFSTFSIIVFAFTGHQNMFSIINEAADKSLRSLTSLAVSAIAISSALFVVVGLSGYLTFGDLVNGNVILSYPPAWSTTVGRGCIVFMVIFSFPLMLHPSRISVNNIYFWFTRPKTEEQTPLLDEESIKDSHIVPFPPKVFYTLTGGLLVAAYVLALTIKSFALVLALVGATGSTAISFILPGLFGYKLIGDIDPTPKEKFLKYASLSLTVWGVAVMALCLYTSLFIDGA